MSKYREHSAWVISIGLAAYFGFFGTAKLIGEETLHLPFTQLGLSTWYGYFIATLEVILALGLLFKRVASMSGIGISILIIGMAYYHFHYQLPFMLVTDALLFAAAVGLGFLRHDDCITMQES